MTARDVIKRSLRLIGALATGETPTADEQADALAILNDMVESWANDGLMVYQNYRQSFALTSSKQSYTIGATGDFVTDRPLRIADAAIEIVSSTPALELPIQIMGLQEWAQVLVKTMPGTISTKMFMEDAYPNAKIYLWPIPTVANNLILYTPKVISQFTTVDTIVSLPPGYARAIKYNLAVELAPEFGKTIDDAIMAIAIDSKSDIKRVNTDPVYMVSDAANMAGRRLFNYLTGE